jgi:hypothetical protein
MTFRVFSPQRGEKVALSDAERSEGESKGRMRGPHPLAMTWV